MTPLGVSDPLLTIIGVLNRAVIKNSLKTMESEVTKELKTIQCR
jgi:hypothetical protein